MRGLRSCCDSNKTRSLKLFLASVIRSTGIHQKSGFFLFLVLLFKLFCGGEFLCISVNLGEYLVMVCGRMEVVGVSAGLGISSSSCSPCRDSSTLSFKVRRNLGAQAPRESSPQARTSNLSLKQNRQAFIKHNCFLVHSTTRRSSFITSAAADSTSQVKKKNSGTETDDKENDKEDSILQNILPSSLNPLDSSDEESKNPVTESPDFKGHSPPKPRTVPYIPADSSGTLVSEVILDGDDLTFHELPQPSTEQQEVSRDPNPVMRFLNPNGREFSLAEVGGFWKTGKEAGEAQVPDLAVSSYDVKDGDVSPVAQWTSTELTMQHSQLARIATDLVYLQNAFAFFGGVRVVEALLSVYSTSPPDFGKLKELLNALDPVTIAWLAHNLRQPVEGILDVDPVDLDRVINLKANLWEELHKFYERQWKVVS